ncbi:MAG: hypothetical protein IJ877_01650 [Candidatus Gastranaerophilales bacterium]|nr:hypothetical protein [Candidatus Gastranaerophilales bacterium]
METIKEIKLSNNKFNVFTDSSSLKLNYQDEPDRYVIDISDMNLLKATRIAILASTYCFINNFKKKLCWVVADDEIRRAISILRLRNVEGMVKAIELKPCMEYAS